MCTEHEPLLVVWCSIMQTSTLIGFWGIRTAVMWALGKKYYESGKRSDRLIGVCFIKYMVSALII